MRRERNCWFLISSTTYESSSAGDLAKMHCGRPHLPAVVIYYLGKVLVSSNRLWHEDVCHLLCTDFLHCRGLEALAPGLSDRRFLTPISTIKAQEQAPF